MPDWTTQRVEQLATDAAALKAARGLAKSAKWVSFGTDARLLWGQCQGSGQNPYQVRIDLMDAANKCSCPSRKLPCKHALGLLLLLAAGTSIPTAAPPDFAAQWSQERAQRAAARAARQADPAKVPDPAQQAKRLAKRETLIEEGLALLDAWMEDLIGQGLASAREQPGSYWAQVAARLVDCQAPGLARRVRQLAHAAASPEWQEQLLTGLARLRLLVDAYRRLASLPPALAAEVRTQAGWSQPQDTLLARPGIRGQWLVLAQRQREEDQLRVQETWLACGSQAAQLLDFASGRQPLPAGYAPGECLDAELVYFDGAVPLRALVKQVHPAADPAAAVPAVLAAALAAVLASAQDIAGVQARYGQLLAVNPWLERWPLVLGPVTVRMQGTRCQLTDAHGRVMLTPPRFPHGWHLLAVSGGEPCRLFGEFNGESFEPLAVEHGGRLYRLALLGGMPVLPQVGPSAPSASSALAVA